MPDSRELPLPAARNETTIEDDLPTCPECGCVMGASERCTACKLRAEGEAEAAFNALDEAVEAYRKDTNDE